MNFIRSTGDARNLAGLQLYQFEAYDKGQNLHLNADPTTVEVRSTMLGLGLGLGLGLAGWGQGWRDRVRPRPPACGS